MTDNIKNAASSTHPVDLVMGSDSDRDIVEKTADILDDFGIGYNVRIISAHRTPEALEEYANEARLTKQVLVIVTFAGMAAALGGDMAARVPVTVIGVPLESKVDTQNSAVGAQIGMPPGSGLTIVGPNQGVNAALAAIRSLAVSDLNIRKKLVEYQEKKRLDTVSKDKDMQSVGFRNWMKSQSK
jgi:5-(carboxyamino)imidazole ribonucleotide mutase